MRAGKFRKYSQKEIPKLKKIIWPLFANWIKNRGGWICFTCGLIITDKFNRQAGHFRPIGKGMTAYHPKNVQVQCGGCNCAEYGNQYIFGKKLDELYGAGTADYLTKLSLKNNYQDEVQTFQTLIDCLKNTPEMYEEVYDDVMEKYEIQDIHNLNTSPR